MEKKKTPLKEVIKESHLYIVKGLFFVLFAINGLLNQFYVFKVITFFLTYLFGAVTSYLVYTIILIFGLTMIVKRSSKFKTSFLGIGCILITVGLMVVFTNSMYSGACTVGDKTYLSSSYLTFNGCTLSGENTNIAFSDAFNSINSFALFPNIDFAKNVGVLSLVIVSSINSCMTNIGSYIIGGLLLCAGLILLLTKPLIQFGNFVKNYKEKINKQEQLRKYRDARDIEIEDKEVVIKPSEKVFASEINIGSSIVGATPISNPKIIVEEKTEVKEKEEVKPDEQKYDDSSEVSNHNDLSINSDEFIQKTVNTEKNKEKDKIIYEDKGFRTHNARPVAIDDDFSLVDNKTNSDLPSSNDEMNEQEFDNFDSGDLSNSSNENIADLKEEPTSDYTDFSSNNIVEESNETKNDVLKETSIEENIVDEKEDQNSLIKYDLGSLDLVKDIKNFGDDSENITEANEISEKINTAFNIWEIGGKIVGYKIGPSVTRYLIDPAPRVLITDFSNQPFLKELTRRLSSREVLFEDSVPNTQYYGYTVRNAKRITVSFKELFRALPPVYDENGKYHGLDVPFGKSIDGDVKIGNISQFPHLMICGTSGSGKTVLLHSILATLILRNTPDDLRIIICDPKASEFGKYRDIPHLMTPIIVEAPKMGSALAELTVIMEERNKIFNKYDVSNLDEYNCLARKSGLKKIPHILVVIDEFADLVCQKNNNNALGSMQRLCQKARSVGINIIIALQAPRSEAMPGLIKTNFSNRVALLCASSVDSINILGHGGAEKLLGNGDMLLSSPEMKTNSNDLRLQGSYIDSEDIRSICEYLRNHNEVHYEDRFVTNEIHSAIQVDAKFEENRQRFTSDEYLKVKEYAMDCDYVSINKIKNRFYFGDTKATSIFSHLKEEGIIESLADGSNSPKGCKVLVKNKKDDEPSLLGSENSTSNYSLKG